VEEQRIRWRLTQEGDIYHRVCFVQKTIILNSIPIAIVTGDEWFCGTSQSILLIICLIRCDSGFGYALAKSLYAKGVPVYAACLNESGAMKLRKEASDSLKTVIVDVTNTESVQNAAAFVQNNLPNNVGKYPVKGMFGNFQN